MLQQLLEHLSRTQMHALVFRKVSAIARTVAYEDLFPLLDVVSPFRFLWPEHVKKLVDQFQ